MPVSIHEPNTQEQRYSGGFVIYMAIIHMLAVLTCVRWWQQLRQCGPKRDTAPDTGVKKINELLSKLKVDELKGLMRERGLRVGGTKDQLITRFRGQQSRASDKQLIYMYDLMQRNHRLQLLVTDIDSRSMASQWIDDAKNK